MEDELEISEYLFDIDYKEWFRYMNEIIKKQEDDIVFFTMAFNKEQRPFYKNMLTGSEESLVQNKCLVTTVMAKPDEFLYKVDKKGLPITIYVGKRFRKEYDKIIAERNRLFI